MESPIRLHRNKKQFGVFFLTEMVHFGQRTITSIHQEAVERKLIKEHQNNLAVE